jgi:hypothetical protein
MACAPALARRMEVLAAVDEPEEVARFTRWQSDAAGVRIGVS